MFSIEVQTTFCAAHALRLPGGNVEPLHGHNFTVTVRLVCARLDPLETVLDFHLVERWLGSIVGPWRNNNLNLIEPFATRVNPTAERIAEQIGLALTDALRSECPQDVEARGIRVAEVRITEAPNCVACWSPDVTTVIGN